MMIYVRVVESMAVRVFRSIVKYPKPEKGPIFLNLDAVSLNLQMYH